MQTLRIKSIWQGQVGIHRKYVKQALLAGEGLRFTYQGQSMEIAPLQLRGAIKSVSVEVFKDHFTGENYRLVYFDWQPQKVQQQLL